MVEELKIIADIMKGVTDGAVYAVMMYMAVDLLKPVGMIAVGGYFLSKIVGKLNND